MNPLHSPLARAFALAAATLSPLPALAQVPPPAAGTGVRITEISASLLLEVPQGYVIEPGAVVQAALLKVGPDPANPVRIAGAEKLEMDKAGEKAPPGQWVVNFNASGFVLLSTDKLRVQLTAPLVSKTRDETAILDAVTKDISLKGADLGRMFLEKEPTRSTVRPSGTAANSTGTTPAPATPPPPGLTFRFVGKLTGGSKAAEKTPLQIRVLDAASVGSGKALPELGKASVECRRSEELGGVYARIHLPSVSLKPGQKVIVEAKLPLERSDEERKKDPKKVALADGRSPALTVSKDRTSDLGILRITLKD